MAPPALGTEVLAEELRELQTGGVQLVILVL